MTDEHYVIVPPLRLTQEEYAAFLRVLWFERYPIPTEDADLIKSVARRIELTARLIKRGLWTVTVVTGNSRGG